MATGPNDAVPDCLTWRVHPARERWGTALFVVVVIAVMGWAAADVMRNPWWGPIAALLLLAPLTGFFLPSEYRIDAQGVTARSPWQAQTYRWADVRRVLHNPRGALLSTRARRSPLDRVRGLHVQFGNERDAVLAAIRSHLSAQEVRPCGG